MYDQALGLNNRALEMFQLNQSDKEVSLCHIRIAQIYSKIGILFIGNAQGHSNKSYTAKAISHIKIVEQKIPLNSAVAGACELLGLEPLYLANEGKLMAFVAADQAQAVLDVVKANPYGQDAAIIGEVIREHPGKVFMETRIGGSRIVDMLAGEQLPRIC